MKWLKKLMCYSYPVWWDQAGTAHYVTVTLCIGIYSNRTCKETLQVCHLKRPEAGPCLQIFFSTSPDSLIRLLCRLYFIWLEGNDWTGLLQTCDSHIYQILSFLAVRMFRNVYKYNKKKADYHFKILFFVICRQIWPFIVSMNALHLFFFKDISSE